MSTLSKTESGSSQKPGASSPTLGAEAQATEPSSAAFPGMLVGSWFKSGAAGP